ncbi:Reticulon-3 [Taenia crassiceps]|uniref:Reticulon-like protein n=1 Tax=Taenia crassiceps TaxID=6207 RepID=A0ABR4QIK3_9CEST
MSVVIDDDGPTVTDLDAPVNFTEQPINMQSDSSNYGSSSLEFIIPSKQQQQQQAVVDVCTEHNIKPSHHTTEADFRATAATRRLNMPEIEAIFLDLIYWKNPQTSALVFALIFTFELGLLVCSVISVVSNFFLLLLLGSALLRVYYRVIGIPEANPLCYFSTCDFRLSPATSSHLAQIITTRVNKLIHATLDLFLLRHIGNSARFGVLLYGLTYIGARFNFLTLCIWTTVVAFGAPKLVDRYKTEINGFTKRLFGNGQKLVRGMWKFTVELFAREKSK